MKNSLGILVSGKGTTSQAIIHYRYSGRWFPIAVVIADRECPAIAIARYAGIPYEIIKRRDFGVGKNFDCNAFTLQVIEVLKSCGVELVVMAGFMTVLSKEMFESNTYKDRVLNTHPSLLPAYPGAHAIQDALDDGAKVTGFTIHVATEKVDDHTRILVQGEVPIRKGDTYEILNARIQPPERRAYPPAIKDYCDEIGLEV